MEHFLGPTRTIKGYRDNASRACEKYAIFSSPMPFLLVSDNHWVCQFNALDQAFFGPHHQNFQEIAAYASVFGSPQAQQ